MLAEKAFIEETTILLYIMYRVFPNRGEEMTCVVVSLECIISAGDMDMSDIKNG